MIGSVADGGRPRAAFNAIVMLATEQAASVACGT
jgi:hypothetical protein